MAIVWYSYHEKDKLNHVAAIVQQQTNIIKTFQASKTRQDALELQTILNTYLFYSKGTGTSLENLNTLYFQNLELLLSQDLQKNFSSEFTANLSGLTVQQTASDSYLKKIKQESKTAAEFVRKVLVERGILSKSDKQFVSQYLTNLKMQIDSLQGDVSGVQTLSPNLQEQFNYKVNGIKTQSTRKAVNHMTKELIKLIDQQAEGSGMKKLNKTISSSLGATAKGFQMEGLDNANISNFKSSKEWQLDKNGYMTYTGMSDDKGNIKINLNSNTPYYINVTNTYAGGSGTKSFSTKTPLFYFLEHELFTEDFTRAYLRYAGWKWVHTRPYEGNALYNMTDNVVGLLALQNGLKTANGEEAEIIVMARRDKPGFNCYAIQDIAEKIISYSGINNNIKVSHLPTQGALRPRSIRSNFLGTYVNVNVSNLQKMLY